MNKSPDFGSRRIYYNNFASHLLNAYSPNMLYPDLPYTWSDEDWHKLIDMIAGFGFNVWEFWLVPRLFSHEGITSDFGRTFIRQVNSVIDYAHARAVQVERLCGLATTGSAWHTLCPNVPEEWSQIKDLWSAWTRVLPGLDIVGIFPGDPGACSRNGCTALTYIDKSVEIAHLIKGNLVGSEIEFHTWGPPFFGWGNLKGPTGWHGEFVQAYQDSAWVFERQRADTSMDHLLKRLPDFPDPTSIAINMGFNPDGNPAGDQDARHWCKAIAQTHRVYSWDFSLTEGENNVIPHYRFDRLFKRRKEEKACNAYSGGICYTMTPLLNQLSLYTAAQSFLNPDADPQILAENFYEAIFGRNANELVPYLHLFEVVKDWGNYHEINLSRTAYHQLMTELTMLLKDLHIQNSQSVTLTPDAQQYSETLLFFAQLFTDLSAPHPDYDALEKHYWHRVYRIYDFLGKHVDPRPHAATRRLINYFSLTLGN
ncbi:MAG: hypothetical protein E4H27_05595 [Anaerolineales bacterium]|nr:MAG: hypothetical protein E4H27_05595 [Anaerolineales bacterium]